MCAAMRFALLHLALGGALLLGSHGTVWAAPAAGVGGGRAVATVDAVAVPLTAPVVVDGNFDEAVWRDAPAIGEFVQREPTEGAPPSERTEARVAYDDHAMYVAVRAFDRDPSRIAALLTRRDERSPSGCGLPSTPSTTADPPTSSR
jgi:hypothetical protein